MSGELQNALCFGHTSHVASVRRPTAVLAGWMGLGRVSPRLEMIVTALLPRRPPRPKKILTSRILYFCLD